MIFLVGWLRGEDPATMFLTSVSLAVAAIPEGLPAIVTVVLALGVQRMAKQRAIIRKLPAVETLGSATVICTDKTGTLTQNQMTVKRLFTANQLYQVTGEGYQPDGEILIAGQPQPVNEPDPLRVLLLAGALCNDAILEEEQVDTDLSWKIIGDPTEGALMVVAAKAGLWRREIQQEYPRLLEVPFDSERKLMTTIHRGSLPDPTLTKLEQDQPEGLWAITKGAPAMLLEDCTAVLTANGIKNLTTDLKQKLLKANSLMAQDALRVLGVALRRTAAIDRIQLAEIESDLIFVGFWGMIDPPRPEVKTAIAESRIAGIKTVMITGDHLETATAIAKELGLLQAVS